MSMCFKSKVAVVTGAAQGLGRAYAEALAKEGAQVCAFDVISPAETARSIEEAGGEALGGVVDTTRRDDLDKALLRSRADLEGSTFW